MIQKIELVEVFESLTEYWSPVILHELNGQYVKAAKVKGHFVWHKHEHEDEYFQVVKGELTMELRDKALVLHAGESVVIPKGVEHRPVAKEECWILLFEPKDTDHTGGEDSELRKSEQPWYSK